MVLQREMKVPVWGNADPGEAISIFVDKIKAETRSDSKGKWKVMLPFHDAGGPYVLMIRGKENTISFKDVYYEEV